MSDVPVDATLCAGCGVPSTAVGWFGRGRHARLGGSGPPPVMPRSLRRSEGDVEVLRSRLTADGLSVVGISPSLVEVVWEAWVTKDSGADVTLDPAWQVFGVTTP